MEPIDVQLIELLYQSVTDPELWQAALARLVARFDSEHAMLFTNKSSAFATPFYASAGLREDDQARYSTPEAERIWKPWQLILPSGIAMSQQAIVSDSDFEKTEGYQELVRPTGCYYGGFLQQDVADLSFHLTLCRPRNSGAFDYEEVGALQWLSPHLTNAMRLQQRLQTLERRHNALAGAIERLDFGAILCDAAGRPSMINKRAGELLSAGDGVALGAQGLRATAPAMSEQMLNAIRTVSGARSAETREVRLPRNRPALPLLLEIMPLPEITAADGKKSPTVIIFITEPDALPNFNREAIADVYHLTPREIEIATLLATGANIDVIATRLSLASSTVRFNLKRAFDKTGARSQAALVSLLRGFVYRRRN